MRDPGTSAHAHALRRGDTRAIVIRLFTAARPIDRFAASGIILASGVICGHLALARWLIASGAAARNSRGPS